MEGKSLGILSSCPSLSPGPVVVLVAGSLGSEEGEHLVTERWRELVGWLAVGSQMPFPCEQKPCQLLGGGDKGRRGSGLWNIGGGAGSRTLREEEGLVWRGGRGKSGERRGRHSEFQTVLQLGLHTHHHLPSPRFRRQTIHLGSLGIHLGYISQAQ